MDRFTDRELHVLNLASPESCENDHCLFSNDWLDDYDFIVASWVQRTGHYLDSHPIWEIKVDVQAVKWRSPSVIRDLDYTLCLQCERRLREPLITEDPW